MEHQSLYEQLQNLMDHIKIHQNEDHLEINHQHKVIFGANSN